MRKIRCLNPNHDDRNASLHIYPDRSYCFSCGFSCRTDEVLDEEEIKKIKKKEPQNIETTISYIKTLPIKRIRGLDLPFDEYGYYVKWPDDSYYLLRRFDDRPRYVGPRGRKPPLFRCRPEPTGKEVIIVVEGSINALSLDLTINDNDIHIVSPGSAGNLASYIDYYIRFNIVYIVVDYDKPGIDNGAELRKQLLTRKKRCRLIAVHEDFNELLQRGGPELVKQEFMKELGLV
jgi:hypothetical protein